MPIEDPFDHEHDLSRVVRAEGAMSMQNEFMRALHMLSEGKTWQSICQPVHEMTDEPDDLFHDLRTISADELETRLDTLQTELANVEKQIDELVKEHINSKELLDLLREGLKETRNVKSDRQQILSELRPLSMKVQEMRQVRDGLINELPSLPSASNKKCFVYSRN